MGQCDYFWCIGSAPSCQHNRKEPGTGRRRMRLPVLFLLYRKFLLNHELCKQIALQKQGTENRRLRLEDIKTFFSKIVIVDIIKFM